VKRGTPKWKSDFLGDVYSVSVSDSEVLLFQKEG
jgi:hypothetical protein